MVQNDFEVPIQKFQDAFERKLGGPFNVVVGESFSMEIDYVKNSLFYMYFGGYLAILVWKCV